MSLTHFLNNNNNNNNNNSGSSMDSDQVYLQHIMILFICEYLEGRIVPIFYGSSGHLAQVLKKVFRLKKKLR